MFQSWWITVEGLKNNLWSFEAFQAIFEATGWTCSVPGKCVAPLKKCTIISTKCVASLQHHFVDHIWRPFRCQNWTQDSALEILSYLLSKSTFFFLIGVYFPCQKLIFPRLVKKCWMRVQQCKVLLQATFGGLPQLQSELMIAHWKSLFVYLSFELSRKWLGHSIYGKSWFSQGNSISVATLLWHLCFLHFSKTMIPV